MTAERDESKENRDAVTSVPFRLASHSLVLLVLLASGGNVESGGQEHERDERKAKGMGREKGTRRDAAHFAC